MVDGDFRVGGLLFLTNFDSANLARVEKVHNDEAGGCDNGNNAMSSTEPKPDYDFNVWLRPDCAGTEFENGNRSWFYFGVRGYSTHKLIRINIVNMNRQGKLYGQGYSPVTRSLPGHPKWERIRDKPTFEAVENDFRLTFHHRFQESRGTTTYFAFAYPWSYTECTEKLDELSSMYSYCSNLPPDPIPDTVYLHRECLCKSLEGRRVELITVSSCHGIQVEREHTMDHRLFPEQNRCRKFKNKRVFVLSARIHPGETPSSFVFNGFLNFLLRLNDERAKMLRKKYVFKLIPMLNPDGVYRGHYRTDTRGVNLNRVYTDPDPVLHPAVFGMKSLIVYHHVNSRIPVDIDKCKSPFQINSQNHITECDNKKNSKNDQKNDATSGVDFAAVQQRRNDVEPLDLSDLTSSVDTTSGKRHSRAHILESSSDSSIVSVINSDSSKQPRVSSLATAKLAGLNVIGDRNPLQLQLNTDSDDDIEKTEHLGNEGSENDGNDDSPTPTYPLNSPHLVSPCLLDISPEHSGIAFYIDLHGHASKRGCFIYGNSFDNEEKQIENMLYPKLIAMHSPNFDFLACNFSERNMYLRDKRDGLSKEGSGRVAVYKSIGIIHSYTLECNYNTGRIVNSIAPAFGDSGRATPPPLAGFPPKFSPSHYEDVGKAVSIAALELTDSNPWSRITLSEHCSLAAIRESLKRYLRGIRGQPVGPKVTRSLPAKVNKPINPAVPAATRLLPRRQVHSESHPSTDCNNSSVRVTVIPRKPVTTPAIIKRDVLPVTRVSVKTTVRNQRRASLNALTLPVSSNNPPSQSVAPKTGTNVALLKPSARIEEEKVEALRNIQQSRNLNKVCPAPVVRLTATAPADCTANRCRASSLMNHAPSSINRSISHTNQSSSYDDTVRRSISHTSQLGSVSAKSHSHLNILSPPRMHSLNGSIASHQNVSTEQWNVPVTKRKIPNDNKLDITSSLRRDISAAQPRSPKQDTTPLVDHRIRNIVSKSPEPQHEDISKSNGKSRRKRSVHSHNVGKNEHSGENETNASVPIFSKRLGHIQDRLRSELVTLIKGKILSDDNQNVESKGKHTVKVDIHKRRAKRINKIYKSFNDGNGKTSAGRLSISGGGAEIDVEKKIRRRKRRSMKGQSMKSRDKVDNMNEERATDTSLELSVCPEVEKLSLSDPPERLEDSHRSEQLA